MGQDGSGHITLPEVSASLIAQVRQHVARVPKKIDTATIGIYNGKIQTLYKAHKDANYSHA
ncbi:MAG: hypothetical protein ACYC4K_04420 [Thiobacillus sp.]